MKIRHHSPVPAFLAALVGIGLFSVMDAVMKDLVLSIGTYAALFWRMCVGSVMAGGLFLMSTPRWPGPHALRLHLVRGVISSGIAALFFWGLAQVPLAQGVALSFVAPLAAIFLAASILDEPVGRQVIVASLVALAGIAVILAGQARADLGPEALLGSAAILASALCYGYNIVLMRQQALVAGPRETTFFQNLIVLVTLALAWPLTGGAELPPSSKVPLILAVAALATASLMILAWAYARAHASYLSATEYSAFLWATLLGWIIFSERVSPFTVAGACLIVIGCVLAVRSTGRGEPPLETGT